MAGLDSTVCPGGTKIMQRSGQSGEPQLILVGADYRQCDRLCMQDNKANFRPIFTL